MIPQFFDSPGMEPDAWRMLLAARYMAEHHAYVASRLPGFPIPEGIFSLLASYPLLVTLALTFIVSLGGFVSFYRIAGIVGLRDRLLLTLAFACTPVVLINSLSAMDYMWAISFALISLLQALEGRRIAAGVLLGIAVGCRISTLLMVAPVSYVIWSITDEQSLKIRDCLLFLLSAIGVSVACYYPVFITYGIAFLAKSIGTNASILQLAKFALLDSLGPIGILALVAAATVRFMDKRPEEQYDKVHFVQWNRICLLVIGLFGFLYILLPVKAGYLIPLIPFALMLMELRLSRRAFRILAVGLILSPFLLSIDAKDRPWSSPQSPVSVQMNLAGRSIVVDFLLGPLTQEFLNRQAQLSYSDSILVWAKEHSRDKILIVAGVWYPALTYLANADTKLDGESSFAIGDVRLAGLLDGKALSQLADDGFRVVYLPGQDKYEFETYGTDLHRFGATQFQIRQPE